MPHQRVGFFRRFDLKRGIDFVHFGLESGMVFNQENYGSVRTYLLFYFQMSKREREYAISTHHRRPRPGADSGGEGKSKRAGKNGAKKSNERGEELLWSGFPRMI